MPRLLRKYLEIDFLWSVLHLHKLRPQTEISSHGVGIFSSIMLFINFCTVFGWRVVVGKVHIFVLEM